MESNISKHTVWFPVVDSSRTVSKSLPTPSSTVSPSMEIFQMTSSSESQTKSIRWLANKSLTAGELQFTVGEVRSISNGQTASPRLFAQSRVEIRSICSPSSTSPHSIGRPNRMSSGPWDRTWVDSESSHGGLSRSRHFRTNSCPVRFSICAHTERVSAITSTSNAPLLTFTPPANLDEFSNGSMGVVGLSPLRII